jgi:hypothetical protein
MLRAQTVVEPKNAAEGTLDLHAIRPKGGDNLGCILKRRLGCACNACTSHRYDDCENMQTCGPWVEDNLGLLTEAGAKVGANLALESVEEVLRDGSNLLADADNVAVQGFGEDDFFLMKLVKAPFVLTTDFEHHALRKDEDGCFTNHALHGRDWCMEALAKHNDGWGRFLPGQEVVIGFWYRHVKGRNWELLDQSWGKRASGLPAQLKKTSIGFPFVVCTVDMIKHWGFPMTPGSLEGVRDANRVRGVEAEKRLFHLHSNTESQIEDIMEPYDERE